MRIVSLFGAKHGVGTSTTAALLHVQSPGSLLLAHDVEEMYALLGMQLPFGEPVLNVDHPEWAPDNHTVLGFDRPGPPRESHLRTARFSAGAELIVMDFGTMFPTVGAPVMVTDNGYLSMRQASKRGINPKLWKCVAIIERTRALGLRDIEAVVNCDVVPIERDSSVQRACDAGLLAMRSPQHVVNPLTQLLNEVPTCSFSSMR